MAGFLQSAGVYVGGDTTALPPGQLYIRPVAIGDLPSGEELESPVVVSPLAAMGMPPQLPLGRTPYLQQICEWPIGGAQIFVPQAFAPISWASPGTMTQLPPAFFDPWLRAGLRPSLDSITEWNFPWAAILPSTSLGGNYYTALSVPSSAGAGSSVDLGAYGQTRTFLIGGLSSNTGTLYIEVSNDNSFFVPIYSFSYGAMPGSIDGTSIQVTFKIMARYVRVRRIDGTGGSVQVQVGANNPLAS